MCQSVCVSVRLFLKTQNYWLLTINYWLSACICELGYRARIKKVQTTYQNAQEFFQKVKGKVLVSGFGSKQPVFSSWLWTTTLKIRSFLNQSDCRTLQTSIFKKQAILNMYLDIILWPYILRANGLIKCFCLVIVRLANFVLTKWIPRSLKLQ